MWTIPMPTNWWDWFWLVWRVVVPGLFLLGSFLWVRVINRVLVQGQAKIETMARTEATLQNLVRKADELDKKLESHSQEMQTAVTVNTELTKEAVSSARTTLHELSGINQSVQKAGADIVDAVHNSREKK